jgi:hypothetical protein
MKKILAFTITLLFFVMVIFPSSGIQIDNKPIIKTNPVNPSNGTFMKTFGGDSEDNSYCVQQTSDGGYILVGYTRSFGAGGSDVWLIKTQSNGIKKWDRTFGGTENDKGYSVQQTTDGGYVITGKTGGDVWLIKTDSFGNKIWDRTFGGKDTDTSYCVKQTTDGGYILTGETSSYAGFKEAWLIKTDSNGSMMWNKTYGSGSAYCVQQTTDGGYILTGATCDDAWLIRTDTNGKRIWDKTYDILEFETARCVQQTTDGGYIITGDTSKFSYWGVFLIKTTDYGNTVWSKTFPDTNYEESNYVQQTTDGGYIITGCKSSSLWLIKTDSYGRIMWHRIFGIIVGGTGYCVKQTSDGGYVITGETTGLFGSDDSDVWLIKTDKDGKPRDKSISSLPLSRFLERYPMLNPLLQRLNIL